MMLDTVKMRMQTCIKTRISSGIVGEDLLGIIIRIIHINTA